MKNVIKIKFSDIAGMLERDEMREIIGGCGSTTGSGGNGFGGGSPALSSNPFDSSFTGSNYGGFGGNNAVGGGVFGNTGNFAGAGNSSYPGSLYYNANTTGTNNSSTSSFSSSYDYNYNNMGGWIFNADGSRTTNDPTAISRYLGFLNANNGNVTNNQMYDFLNKEVSTAGREINNSNLPGIVLDGLPPIINNYKEPSTLPQGVVLDGGVLHFNSLSSSEGGKINSTPAVLTSFTKSQVTDGLNNVNFSGMALKSIIDWDPTKKEFNFNDTFQPIMKLNSEAVYAIALYEKLSLKTYDKDSNTAKHTTVGFGHKLHDGAIKNTDPKSITFDQAITFLAQDIISAENTLNQKIENMDLTGKFNRNQYLALADMTFNGGNLVDNVLVAMKFGGVESANKVITDMYINETNGGVKDRRYFNAEAFVNNRSVTPEEARAELIKLGY